MSRRVISQSNIARVILRPDSESKNSKAFELLIVSKLGDTVTFTLSLEKCVEWIMLLSCHVFKHVNSG